MTCHICKHGETAPGTATVTVERGSAILVVRRAPADVCDVCGEQYVSEETTRTILTALDRAVAEGVQFEAREFDAA
ncbi:MAG: type II toxin-antitoxin system MqsA family antitoxin [Dehalococcoidia bacterium]